MRLIKLGMFGTLQEEVWIMPWISQEIWILGRVERRHV